MNKFMALLFLFSPLVVEAQGMVSLLSPRAPDSQFMLEGALYSDQREAGVFIDRKIFKNENHRLSINSRYKELRIEQKGPLPRSYESFEGGLQYTRLLSDQKFWSLQTQIGSESDKIFANKDVNTLSANFLFRSSSKWLFLANYSNNRSFLNNIPLPSVIYIHSLSRDKVVLLGIPFIFIKYPLSEKFSYSLSSFIPFNHSLVLNYQVDPSLKIGLGIQQAIETFLRSDREKKEDRVFLRRRSAFVELSSSISRQLELQLNAGYSFGMLLSESESFSDRDRTLTNLEDGVFASLQLSYKAF